MAKKKKKCEHDEAYPVAVFWAAETYYIFVTCDGCGTDFVEKGQPANDTED